MGHSHYDPAGQCRPAWNAGKTVGAKRPLTQKQIWAVRSFWIGKATSATGRLALFEMNGAVIDRS